MLSIQTVTAAKKTSIVAAMLLLIATLGGCGNKEEAAYRLAAQAQQQLEQGDVASARLTIDKALRQRDDLVELHLLKGRVEIASQSLDSAFISYYNALALDPVNMDALQSVAMLGLQTGHTDEAETAANKLLTLSPQNGTGLLVRGLLALERKRFPEALAAADGILANAPTDEGAVILKARALYLAGSGSEARDLLGRTIQLSGNTPGLARIGLEIARAEGDAPAMLKTFGVLRELAQNDPQFVFDEANVRYKTGDRQGALRLVTDGLLNTKLPTDDALELIDLWREYDPAAPTPNSLSAVSDPAVREGLARFLIERGRFGEAETMLAGAGAAAPGIRSRILFATGKNDAARQLADQVIAQDPSQCDARITLANLAIAARDPTAAVTHGQQAAAECPGLPDGWLAAAAAYVTGGQVIQATRVYRDAINRNGDSLRLHSAYVEWLQRSGRGSEAEGVARHLIRFAPNRISSWRLMARTCSDQPCRDNAARGLARATTSFVIDLRPGKVARRGLFARLGQGAATK